MVELGQRYPEIAQFQRIPGIGVVGAHVFRAFIQTPHRFATKQKLWSDCQLGIRERSSAGKSLSYQRLDRSGSGELKAMSYRCWQSALQTTAPNEASQFYDASLESNEESNPCTSESSAKHPHGALDDLEEPCRRQTHTFLFTS